MQSCAEKHKSLLERQTPDEHAIVRGKQASNKPGAKGPRIHATTKQRQPKITKNPTAPRRTVQ